MLSSHAKSCPIVLENKKQLFIPTGFAHGFVVLSDWATLFYKCTQYYHPKAEGGIIYNDPSLSIDWRIPNADLILSNKDKMWLPLSHTKFQF